MKHFAALFLATFAFAGLVRAQTSGAFVTTGPDGVVARPVGFWTNNSAAAKAAMGLAGAITTNQVPGLTASAPGASRYYGTDTNGAKGYFPLPTGGGGTGNGDMLKADYDIDGDGIVDEAEAVAWASIIGLPSTFAPSPHTHTAADITGGVIAPARLGTGSPGSGNYLRGDGAWDPIGVSDLADMTTIGEAVATAADAAAARSVLGVVIGSTPGTYAAGDDTRMLSTGQKASLTGGGDSADHYHAADRNRASHIGTQPRSSISDFAHQGTHQSGGSDALTGNLDATARTTVRKNSGADVGSRRRINIVEGSGITATIADDPANEEIDVVLSSTGGGGGSGTNVALLDQAQTFSELQTFAGGIATPSLSADAFNVGTLTITNQIDGAKVGSGINADNITSGTVSDARIASTLARDSEVAAAYQPLDADLTDLSDGSLTGSKVGSGIDDDNVAFDDADNLWAATSLGAALEELNDSINSGAPNGAGAKVHWSQLLGVPIGFADGTDDGAGGGGGSSIDSYVIQFATGDGTGLSDSATYYAGPWPAVNLGSSSSYATTAAIIPVSGNVVRVDYIVRITGTLGTAEPVTNSFRLNDSAEHAQSTALWTNGMVRTAVTGLSVPVTAGDTFVWKIQTPSWLTNPTSTRYAMLVHVERTVSGGGGSGSGSVTSIDISGGTTGLSFAGGPITTNGTLTAGGVLSIAHGGTGQTNAANARAALGAQAQDDDLTDLADGSLTGFKVGPGIDASNVTTGTLPAARLPAEAATDAEVSAGYQPLDADLTDLADGSLTGSKVGIGIDAGNITTGTLPTGRLPTEAATDAEVASNYQPLDADLTDLADGTLTGTKVGSGIDAINITTGTLSEARLPSNVTLDSEASATYEPIRTTVSQAEAEAGTSPSVRAWTPQRVAQAIAALGGGGGGGATEEEGHGEWEWIDVPIHGNDSGTALYPFVQTAINGGSATYVGDALQNQSGVYRYRSGVSTAWYSGNRVGGANYAYNLTNEWRFIMDFASGLTTNDVVGRYGFHDDLSTNSPVDGVVLSLTNNVIRGSAWYSNTNFTTSTGFEIPSTMYRMQGRIYCTNDVAMFQIRTNGVVAWTDSLSGPGVIPWGSSSRATLIMNTTFGTGNLGTNQTLLYLDRLRYGFKHP